MTTARRTDAYTGTDTGGVAESGSSTALERRLRDTVRGDIAVDAGTRGLYTMDASNHRLVPTAVVVPRDRDDIVAAVAACREAGASVVTRGGGTSIAGNATGTGVVLDTSRYMNRILDIDPEARTARVQPGVVLDDLRAAAGAYGLTFGPDPSTHDRCTLGGMIGNNSCGSHSVAWGKTIDSVESLEVLLHDGTRMEVGAAPRDELDRLAALPGREGQVHAQLRDLVRNNLGTIREGLPDFPRRVSGYSLDHLLPEKGCHVARTLVGTEGTCVSVLEATVRLVPTPNARVLAVLGFPSDVAAAEAVPEILPQRPMTVEGMDAGLVDIQRRRGQSVELPDGNAWLFVEVDGDDLDAATQRANDIIARTGRPSWVVQDPAEQRALWGMREAGAGLGTRLPDGSEAWPGWEDAAVPPERLADYLRGLKELMGRYGLHGLPYGHYGDGCIHIRLDFDLLSAQGVANYRSFLEEAADCVVAHGGSLSGEHGDGQARSGLLERMYSPEVIALFERFKAIWDPDDAMNPGVIVRPYDIDETLRFDALPAREPRTVFALTPDDGSLSQAARRCVGLGKCRSADGGVMCPSYRVTRDEKHSTRGRARLLFEMLSGEVITDGWRSREVHDALDLCLACKGCKSDCPVEVDMATYKAEFLHHHYAGRVRPAAHYSMGFLPLWARLAGAAPSLVNAATNSPMAPLLKRAAGVTPERALPTFATATFSGAFRRRQGRQEASRIPADTGSTVVLWPDTFTDTFDPEIGAAAVRVLEDAGFSVLIPPAPVCCGLTWVSTGQLGVAKRVMRASLRLLAPYLDAGLPVAGLEPSCTAALRGDMPELLGDDERARSLARRTYTLAEFLESHAPDWTPPRSIGRDALTQLHCHQHAELGFGPDEKLMAKAGVRNQTLDSGCCGLAGNFGFEQGHYDVSMACAERVLAPAVRQAAPETLVISDGFSCRTQIMHATHRTPRHLAQVLADTLDGSG